MKTEADDFVKARRSAYRLIKYRERSSREIGDRLKRKGFESHVCCRVIAELEELGYLDDTRFANAMAEDIIRFKPAGIEFIRSKLRSKGIASGITDAVISRIKSNYDECDSAYKLAFKKSGRMADIDTDRAKRRIYNFLARRRFSQSAISEALGKIYDK